MFFEAGEQGRFELLSFEWFKACWNRFARGFRSHKKEVCKKCFANEAIYDRYRRVSEEMNRIRRGIETQYTNSY